MSLKYTVEPRLSVPRLSGFLDYPDFFSGPNLVMNISMLVTIKIRTVAISFLNHLKVQSNVRGFFYFQTAKAVLAHIVTNEEHSIEF